MTPRPVIDSTLSLLINGFAWLPSAWRRRSGNVVRTRLTGRHAVALRGPEAVEFVYDDKHLRREGTIPEPIKSTLFGHGGVQDLDGERHRVRRELFLRLLTDPGNIAELVAHTTAAWDDAARTWSTVPQVTVFDEASRVLLRGVSEWAGIRLDGTQVEPLAHDLVSTVDGFATLGPRHWRARRARTRLEEWATNTVLEARARLSTTRPSSPLDDVARHREMEGALLEPRIAGVELLNVIRPTVAVAWYVTFAAHALQLWPENRDRLRVGDQVFSRAFANEVRRFYPFAPFIGGRAVSDLTWLDEPIPSGSLVLLDLYGQNHDAALWDEPYRFRPERFLSRPAGHNELVPQGGGDPRASHRCPGEDLTVSLLTELSTRLARLDYAVPEQDLTIPFDRIPTRPRSGIIVANVRPPG